MKNIILIISSLILSFSGLGQTALTFTTQADLDAYNFQSGVFYDITLNNDTTNPVSMQISDILSMSAIDSVLMLEVNHTLIRNLSGLENLPWLGSLSMKGNKNMDTLFLANSIQKLGNLWLEQTSLQYVYGLDSLTAIGRVYIIDNDKLKSVHLGLQNLGNDPIGSQLEVRLNDSLKTFYWGDTHHQLSQLSFFDNRQLKHVHIETTKDKVYDGPLTGNGGFSFNPDLDSITGFKGLVESSILQIKDNYNLNQVCVLQKPTQRNIDNNSNIVNLYKIQSNGSNLQSLNDLLTADCSWLPNGIKEPIWSKLEIYPNPAQNEVYITAPSQRTSYYIYDVSGKLVRQGLVETSGRIGLATISNGMYVLMVDNKRSKLVVQ